MGLTVGGVAWTVLERTPDQEESSSTRPGTRDRLIGLLLAGVGALGQAGGLIFSKLGMESLPDPFGATQIRVLAGIAGFSVLFFATGWWGHVADVRRNGRALGMTALGSIFGPFLGVSLSLLAVHKTQAGIA